MEVKLPPKVVFVDFFPQRVDLCEVRHYPVGLPGVRLQVFSCEALRRKVAYSGLLHLFDLLFRGGGVPPVWGSSRRLLSRGLCLFSCE